MSQMNPKKRVYVSKHTDRDKTENTNVPPEGGFGAVKVFLAPAGTLLDLGEF